MAQSIMTMSSVLKGGRRIGSDQDKLALFSYKDFLNTQQMNETKAKIKRKSLYNIYFIWHCTKL